MTLPGRLRKRGMALAPDIRLVTSEQPDGTWAAWIERAGLPLEIQPGRPRVFYGATRYRAQCAAMKWIRGEDAETALEGVAEKAWGG